MRKKIVAFLALSMSSWANADDAAEFVVGISEYCPFMCTESESGFTVDTIKAIFPKARFVPLPWSTSVAQVRKGKIQGIMAPAKSEVPDLIYPEEEVASQNECFYTHRDNPWRYRDFDSFKGASTLVFNGWSHEKMLNEHFGKEAYQNLFHSIRWDEKLTQRSLSMLAKKRIDAFWFESSMFGYFAANNPEKTADLINAGCIETHPLYIGFSPKNEALSKQLAEHYDRKIQQLRTSGELQAILDRYNVKNWRR